MKLIPYLFCFVLIFQSALSFGQDQFVIRGTIVDSVSNEVIPYATVLLKNKADSSRLNGVTTNLDGQFEINSNQKDVYLELRFIGYISKEIENLDFKSTVVELGMIPLSVDVKTLDGVEVSADRSTMEFKLDKRVFNVGSDLSSSGSSAMDVLNSVPSVNVDIEGNITLRGNSGAQILIDGKPSAASDDPNSALGTITADMIESIEVITNPSAKYNAEGTSGIINIILKKDEKKGFNGSISLNTGYPNNHSVGGSLNLRTTKFNFFTQFGAGYRTYPRISESINDNLETGTRILSEGEGFKNENFYNITIGTDYHINDRNVLTLSGQFAYELESEPSTTIFSIYDGANELQSSYTRTENTEASNPKYQYDLNYKKTFKNNKEHTLLFGANGRFFGKDQSSNYINEVTAGTLDYANQFITTDFYNSTYNFQLDYANPLSKKFTLESGFLYNINDVGNDYVVNNEVDNEWIPDPDLTNNFLYNQKVFGIYGTMSYEHKKWGVKLGLRAENTDLETVLTNTNEVNSQNYSNLFPSLHTSWKITKKFSLQAGYSRRIFRPRLWDLNPFFNIRNSYSIRQGNPDLMPEFADSYELTGIWYLNKVSLNWSLYHLYTTDVMEWVSYFEDNVNINTPVNVGERRKYGVEFNGKYTPNKWLSFNGEANYGYFNRTGTFENQNFDFSGDQWSSRLTSNLKLKGDIEIEIGGNYQSAYKTVQGQVSGYFFADAGLRKKLWDGKGVVNLSVRDIFASRIRESIVDQSSYYLYNFSQRGRFVTLGFSYSFGKGEAMSYSGGKR